MQLTYMIHKNVCGFYKIQITTTGFEKKSDPEWKGIGQANEPFKKITKAKTLKKNSSQSHKSQKMF